MCGGGGIKPCRVHHRRRTCIAHMWVFFSNWKLIHTVENALGSNHFGAERLVVTKKTVKLIFTVRNQ